MGASVLPFAVPADSKSIAVKVVFLILMVFEIAEDRRKEKSRYFFKHGSSFKKIIKDL